MGTSASYTKSYDLNLVVTVAKGIYLGGTFYRSTGVQHGTTSGTAYFTVTTDNASLAGYFFGAWPTADGTYTYPVGGVSGMAFTMQVGTGSSYSDQNNSGKNITVIITGGKLSVKATDITVSNGPETKSLTIDISE